MKWHKDFPILQKAVYLDNAATTQKPQQVLDSLLRFYQESYGNVHRGSHQLTETATYFFESAREKIKAFVNAKHSHECIFVRGTTEGINLVANGFTKSILKSKDEIIISQIEHHANIIPWQMACEYTGAKLRVIPCDDAGNLLLDEYVNLLNEKTKIVALTHVSNVLGTINPIKKLIEMAHTNGTPVLIDGAQAISHLHVDMQKLDCDFYTFSGHKMYGPTGIGVLYGKTEWLARLPHYQGTIHHQLPHKFEAGTPAIAEAVGLGAAIDYINNIGIDKIELHENKLMHHALDALQELSELKLIGNPKERVAILSFVFSNIHPHDIGTVLQQQGIAVRTGQLCSEPTLKRFNFHALTRVSLGLYNTPEDIHQLIHALKHCYHLFKGNI